MSLAQPLHRRDVLAIVPAYNEAASIRSTIRSIREHAPFADIVVVNDGSTDPTARLARSCGVPVLDLSCNLGIGGAVQAGYRFAVEQGYGCAVQIDADGQHDPRELGRMLEAMQRHEADMVVGSRFWKSRASSRRSPASGASSCWPRSSRRSPAGA